MVSASLRPGLLPTILTERLSSKTTSPVSDVPGLGGWVAYACATLNTLSLTCVFSEIRGPEVGNLDFPPSFRWTKDRQGQCYLQATQRPHRCLSWCFQGMYRVEGSKICMETTVLFANPRFLLDSLQHQHCCWPRRFPRWWWSCLRCFGWQGRSLQRHLRLHCSRVRCCRSRHQLLVRFLCLLLPPRKLWCWSWW